MDLMRLCPHKVVNAEYAVSQIKSGSRVFIGTGCGEPQHLIEAMVADSTIQDILVYQMLSSTFSRYIADKSFRRRFFLKLFFISASMRKAAFEGKIDYIPAYLSQIPKLFASQRIGLDVALVQVSPPDKFGYCSLGVSVDITRSGLENARLVIAQVNPLMPRTWGGVIAGSLLAALGLVQEVFPELAAPARAPTPVAPDRSLLALPGEAPVVDGASIGAIAGALVHLHVLKVLEFEARIGLGVGARDWAVQSFLALPLLIPQLSPVLGDPLADPGERDAGGVQRSLVRRFTEYTDHLRGLVPRTVVQNLQSTLVPRIVETVAA